VQYTKGKDSLPLTVKGRLKGGIYELPGNVSSQFFTGLLMALPILPDDSVLQSTTVVESESYINITLDCLRRHGIYVEDLETFIRECADKFKRIKIVGLMTMAPDSDDEDEVRAVFSKLKEVFEDIKDMSIEGVEMKELSMGMSGDYKIAIEEGSTIVRVGTSIFGKRNYNI